MRCIYRFGMYAAHALYKRPPYAIESSWPPRVRGMYAVHTPLALWIRHGQVLIRDIIRSGIAIHTPYETRLKIAVLKWHLGFLGANELRSIKIYLYSLSFPIMEQVGKLLSVQSFPTCSMMGNDREYKYIFILLNSLAPRKPRCHFKTAIFNLVSLIGIFTSSIDNPLRRMCVTHTPSIRSWYATHAK